MEGIHMAITADDKTRELMRRQYRQTGVFLSVKDAETLRKAELTLNRWSAAICNGTIERPWQDDSGDPDTYIGDRPGRSIGGYTDSTTGVFHTEYMFIPDREAGALRRVAEVCKRNGLDYYHQGDPRGCSLYISKAEAGMDDTNYPNYTACHVGVTTRQVLTG
jgi:hypothetical protein